MAAVNYEVPYVCTPVFFLRPYTLYEGGASHSRLRAYLVPGGCLLRRCGQGSGQHRRAGRRRPLPQALRGARRALRALLRRVEHLRGHVPLR